MMLLIQQHVKVGRACLGTIALARRSRIEDGERMAGQTGLAGAVFCKD